MVDYQISNLPRVQLDPREDDVLYDQAKNRTISASNGKLTNYNPSSALNSLITTQVFCMAELFWYLNKLPVALAIELLRLFGIQRSLGTKSRGALGVLLSQALTDTFSLPAGYQIPYRDGIVFVTLEPLSIPPGSYEGTVAVESNVVGTITNVPAFGFVQTQTGLNYVQMIYNKDVITGGTDIEPLEATVVRGQQSIRTRDTLVTLSDYESACQAILGYGSRAIAVSAMDAGNKPDKLGHVHVFLVDAEGVPPSQTTCEAIKLELAPLTFAGSSLWISPVGLVDIRLDAVLEVITISQELSEQCYNIITSYLKPNNYEIGSTLRVKELEYLLRGVAGVEAIQYVTINDEALNLPMPQSYYAPNLIEFTLTLTTANGFSQTYDLLLEPDID